MCSSLPRCKQGFSIIWLLASVAIFVSVSTITLAGLATAQRTVEVRLAAETLAATIRDAQQRSLARLQDQICDGGRYHLERCPASGCTDGVCAASVPPGGYGVQVFTVDETRAYLFSDTDDNGATSFVPVELADQPNEVIEFVTLSPRTGVAVDSMTLNDVPTALPTTGISFASGTGAVKFDGVAGGVLKIYLRWGSNAPTRYVQVDAVSGTVEVLVPSGT